MLIRHPSFRIKACCSELRSSRSLRFLRIAQESRASYVACARSRIQSDQRTVRNYVPISHEARYFFCSGVSLSILIPIAFSLSRAIDLSITKYCSVLKSMNPDIPVTYELTLT